MSYNPWYSNSKISDEQVKCSLCGKWDKYYYSVVSKKTNDKQTLCFECFHRYHEEYLFE